MFKRIITSWWAVPLAGICIPALHTLSLTGVGGPPVTAFGVAAGVLLVPLWLAVLHACRKRWQVARVWPHWLAGGAAELLQLGWCVFAALLFASVAVERFPADDADAAAAAALPAPLPAGSAVPSATPAVQLEEGARPGAYRVHLLLPPTASEEGAFIIRVASYAADTPVDTAPMVHRITDADRAAARDGAMDITFPDVAVYGGSRGQRAATRWRVSFLPDSGDEEPVCEAAFNIAGGAR